MTLDISKVRVGVTGVVSAGPTTATAPTGTSGTLTGFIDLGLVTEDGVTVTIPGAGDKKSIKAWQGGQTVRVIRSATDDLVTIELTLMETKLDVIQNVLGVTVTQTVTEGSFAIDTTQVRAAKSWVIDVVDGAELIRTYAPKGTPVGEVQLVYKNDEPVGYSVSIECEKDSTAGYNVKTWMTALKS